MPLGKRGHGGGGHEGSGERWLLTYADMITLLLALFIFLFSISTVNANKLATFASAFADLFGMGKAPVGIDSTTGGQEMLPMEEGGRKPIKEPDQETEKKLKKVRQKLQGALPKMLESGKMTVEEKEGGLVLRLLDTALFNLGSTDVTPEAQQVLDTIGAALREIDNDVCVEGHTDDLPIRSGRFSSNWELSAERAASVVHYFINTTGIAPERLSLAGYAEYRPLEPNVPGQGNPKNRRVEIRVLGSKDIQNRE